MILDFGEIIYHLYSLYNVRGQNEGIIAKHLELGGVPE